MRRGAVPRSLLIATILLGSAGAGTAPSAAEEKRAPANFVALLGGGGDLPGEDTQFDADLQALAPYLKTPGVRSQALYDGGHARSDRLAQEVFGAGSADPMTPERIRRWLDHLDLDLDQGFLRAGDRYLLVIDSHGSPEVAGKSEHTVMTDAGSWSVAELRALRDKMEAKGVRLGIVDFSCYGGNTLRLADDKTCVISASSADTVAFGQISEVMMSALRAGETMESAYLKSRRETGPSPALPAISSPAGRKAAEALAGLEERMAFTDSSGRDSSSKPEHSLTNLLSEARDCDRPPRSPGLQELVEHLDQLKGPLFGAITGKLRAAIDEYEAMLGEARKALRNRDAVKAAMLARTVPGEGDLKLLDLARMDFAGRRKGLEPLKKTNPGTVAKALGMLDRWQHKASALEKSDPDYRRFLEADRKLKRWTAAAWGYARNVSNAEREVYDLLYMASQRLRPDLPNPCAEFKL